jgi:hypothetical protein
MLAERSRPAYGWHGTDCGCPLGTVVVRPVWHANGTLLPCPAAGKLQAGDPAPGQGRPEAVAKQCEREPASLGRAGLAEDVPPPGILPGRQLTQIANSAS